MPNGKVLIAGSGSGTTAELYDPATGTFTFTGSMSTPRYKHTATLLPNGKVLVAGGYWYPSALSTAELYDPATGTFTATGSLNVARYEHTATLLPNGKVLIAGSRTNTAEVYDPIAGSFTATGSMTAARTRHTATLLPNGKVLVAGGDADPATWVILTAAELYDPATGTFTATGNMITARTEHTVTPLPNGKVLVAGGMGYNDWGGRNAIVASEVYDPAAGTFASTASMATPRQDFTATFLSESGKVLVAGGQYPPNQGTATAELYGNPQLCY